jgi:hypothetical protein
MSDSDVIDRFVGNFRSMGTGTSNDPDKAQYYPRAGVRLRLDRIMLTGNTGGKAYAKIKIDPDGEPFGGARALERAVFRVENDTLVAHDIEVNPGLLLVETLTMGPTGMTHELKFSDGALGTWICVP